MKPELSVVIPVYNEETGLPQLYARLYPALDALAARGVSYEIVFVNDGSRDNTALMLADQFRLRPDVTRVVLFSGNYGQHMAILAGFQATRGEIVVTLDADLQNPPEEIGALVDKMREGYDSQIGEQGTALSAGQAQRVALARALYGNPFLIVLDEPNSNLDTEGDEALTRAIRGARGRGAIVIVVAHRPIGIEAVDQLLVLKDGRMQAFGPKEAVLGQVLQRVAPPPPIKIVSDAGAAKS